MATSPEAAAATTFFPNPIITLEQVKRIADYGTLEHLETLIIKEAWHAFIGSLFDRGANVRPKHIPWLESRIPELFFKVNNGSRNCADLAERLLDWYLFNSHDDVATRALAFAIAFCEKGGYDQKKVFRRIRDIGYWSIPSIEPFIVRHLRKINPESFTDRYFESDWIDAERALDLVMRFEDVTMIPILESILQNHDSGKVSLEDGHRARSFLQLKITAILRGAVLRLKQIQKEQQPSLSYVVGKPLAEAANLSGAVLLKVRHDETFPVARREEGILITVTLECERQDDIPRLRDCLAGGTFSIGLAEWRRFVCPQQFDAVVNPETFVSRNILVPQGNATARFCLAFKIEDKTITNYFGYTQPEPPSA
ncbi:MAG TPA: hypothetical protein VMT99_02020 [Candidatus Paceibacterota bacterium]|nr:hypothetical protein [Candidatus Paceibacterota bacterium]